MALKRYQETFGSVQPDGDVFVLAGASVEVRDETSGALAAIFEDRAGNTAKANPFTADSNGYGFFYAADGRYRIKATLSGETVDIRDVLLGVGATTINTETGEQTLVDAFNQRVARATSNITINVPTDRSTVKDALEYLSSFYRADQGIIATVNIESGHVIEEGFRIDNCDLSWVTIESVDATVLLSSTFTPVSTEDQDQGVPRTPYNAFVAVDSKMPKWDVLIDATNADNVNGGYVLIRSDGYVKEGAGLINPKLTVVAGTGQSCRVVAGSRLNGFGSVWRGATGVGVAITQAAIANIAESDCKNSGVAGIDISRGSVVYALDSDVTGSVTGVHVRRSFISGQGINFNNCTSRAVWADLGSMAFFGGSTMDSCPFYVLQAQGSWVDVTGATDLGSAISVSGTSIGVFNYTTGRGTLLNQDDAPGSPRGLRATSSVTIVDADLVSIPAGTFNNIYTSTSGPSTIIGGSVYGKDVGLKITIDGTVVLNDVARARGTADDGSTISVVNIPPCFSNSTIAIEAYNRSSTSGTFGWRLYRL